jgi:FkbH-like protein
LEGYIYLCPESADEEKRLIFTWLDFVKYKPKQGQKKKVPGNNKVKCVVWDLDNTFWKGIFIEQENVEVKEEAIQLVKKLDERGILQSIASKNDFEPCWEKLKAIGMEKYFLAPAINWGPKSKNIAAIAEKLNIGLDTVAVIDDSSFERAEIKAALSQVRVYSDQEITHIADYDEFKVLVSEESKDRRNKYLKEIERIESKEQFAGSYEDFLISCKMEVEAFVPNTDEEIDRCFELIQRSNQLNLSTIRYSKEQFYALLADRQTLSVGLRCEDRFGQYGIIGFSSISLSQRIPLMENLVLSCRIAQKRVEHAFMKEITALLYHHGYSELWAQLVPTAKNGPLSKVFSELPFTLKDLVQDKKILGIQTDALAHSGHIMKFTLQTTVTENHVFHATINGYKPAR